MKAVRYEAFQAQPALVTVDDPEPTADGVVVEVKASGLCRSDWHGWMGHDADVQPPQIPGHEFAGIIVAVGKAVKSWKAGDRVTVPFCMGCGFCPQCRQGDQQICDHYYQPGFTGPGTFAEYVPLPYADTNLVALPENMSYTEAAILGCRFITAYRAVVAQGRAKAGDWIAVYGCGGVGLSAIMIAHALGARVIAIDIDDDKLAFSKKMGAEYQFNAQKMDDLPAAIHEITSGGVHLSMDALGSTTTCINSILSLRKRGRHLQVGLMTGEHAAPPIPMGPVIANELELLGSHGMAAHRYPGMLRLIESGRLQPGKLRGKTIGLADVPEALMNMDQFPGIGVTIVEMD